MVGVVGPLLAAVAVASLVNSARHYAGGYDWRYQVMCKLGSASENPAGCGFWSFALGIVCATVIPSVGYFRARVAPVAPRLAALASWALWIGAIAGIAVALDGVWTLSLNGFFHKAHEVCATLCFAAFCIGSLTLWFAAICWLHSAGGWSGRACTAISLLVLVPFAGAMLSQAYLFFVPNDLGWVGPEWAKLGVPIYLSFAFWEWLAAAGIYLCLYIVALLLPPSSRPLSVESVP